MRLGIRAKLLLVWVAVIAVSVLTADSYLTSSLEAELTRRVEEDLFVRAELAAREVSSIAAEPDDLTPWDEVADALAGPVRGRVSIIRADGLVLGDSELDGAALAGVERHDDRPEVIAARGQDGAAERSSSTRMSSTVRERMMYAAVPFWTSRGVSGVARLAVPLTQVDTIVGRARKIVFIGSAIALLLAIMMSIVATQLIFRPLRAFTNVARRLSAGDLEARTRAAGNDEVAELGRALDGLASSLFGALGELRHERDVLGGVLDGMREGVMLVDAQGTVALTNPALREMLLLGSEMSGKRPLELLRSAELNGVLEQVVATGTTATAELELGELKPRHLLVHATPLVELGGTLAVFVDVTDVRRLESLRREFVANVSHELRTPIATVLSAAETLRSSSLSGEPAREFLEIIDRSANRLHKLVEDLLDLSRIESRQLALEIEPIELATALDPILPSCRDRAANKNVRVSVKLASDARVLADRRALEQVLSNLIDNAVKYTSEGSTITIRSVVSHDSVLISVADTGPGIEARHLPRLFERFYRADTGRSRELGGTGLGLSIVKNLTEAMAGTIAVQSAVGLGATFTVSLPRG